MRLCSGHRIILFVYCYNTQGGLETRCLFCVIRRRYFFYSNNIESMLFVLCYNRILGVFGSEPGTGWKVIQACLISKGETK